MAVLVVHLLEVIQVEHRHRQRRAVALRPLELLGEPAPQVAIVQEAGALVGDGELQQPLIGVAQLLVRPLERSVEIALLEGGAQDGVELVEMERLDDKIVGSVL